MKITSMEEYGLRCLLRVARQEEGEPISAQDIAEREGISMSYTQKLLRALTAGELLVSYRGAQGGYALARPVDTITLGDAIRVLGGMIELDHICEKHTGEQDVCQNAESCSLRPVWSCLSEFIVRTFDAIPLSMLLRDEEEVAARLMQLVPRRVDVDEVVAQPAPGTSHEARA